MPDTTTTQSPTTSVSGSVERVTFHNPDSGYCVLKVKAKGHPELVTIVGTIASITGGEFIEAEGMWTHHREFGQQLKATSLRSIPPSTLEGIERYLGSGLIKGIGPHFAKQLVKAFQHEVFEVIEKSPEKLRRIPGLGRGRIEKITSAWGDQKVIRDIMVFLQSHGVGTSRAVRIYKTYGVNSVQRVKSDPYQLSRDIPGIGFKIADAIAMRLGIPRDSLMRARAGASYALMEKVSEGHCAFPEAELVKGAETALEIPEATLRQALGLEIAEGYLHRETIDGVPCLYPAGIYHHEAEVAELVQRLLKGPLPWDTIDTKTALPWVEKKLSLELAPLQREAVARALHSKVIVITGGPGTGKTTLTRAILALLAEKHLRIVLCSPTGRAAKRLAEVTGREAKTIHRLLGFDRNNGGFQLDRQNPLEADCVLVDEASMVDIQLMHSLLKAVPPNASLIIVGDVDQIPSVGPGAVLKALIDSGVVPTVKLTQIFRQAATSEIVANAHRVNHGEMPDLSNARKDADFFFLSVESPDAAVQKVVELVKTRVPKKFGFDPVRDIQVLCPMNRGTLGTRTLNVELQKALNPSPENYLERFGYRFSPGDKVMVTLNDYEKDVFNGDIGTILSIDHELQEVKIDFDRRDVTFEFGEMDIVTLAYATTIHKAQGSEYPAVILPMSTQHFVMLKRNLLYTGITRGKKLVILVGQKKAISLAVRAESQGKRWNKLAERLKGLPRLA